MNSLYERYFLFSQSHYEKIKEIEKKSGNPNYKLGTVLVNGLFKPYTAMVRHPEEYERLYGDSKTVLVADIRKVKYNPPT